MQFYIVLKISFKIKKSKFNGFFHNLKSTAENSDFSLIALWWVHKCTYMCIAINSYNIGLSHALYNF
jgi:hypothetical protein